MIRALIFDLGGVILPFADPLTQEPLDVKWERILELEPGSIKQRIWIHDNLQRATTGELSITELRGWIRQELGLSSAQMLEWDEDIWAGILFEDGIAEWLESLREHYKIASLSNAWSGDRAEVTKRYALHELADLIVISAEEGMMKPDERIYRITLERLGVKPEETVFVDDRQENVDAARRLGIFSVLRVSTEQMMTDVEAVVRSHDSV